MTNVCVGAKLKGTDNTPPTPVSPSQYSLPICNLLRDLSKYERKGVNHADQCLVNTRRKRLHAEKCLRTREQSFEQREMEEDEKYIDKTCYLKIQCVPYSQFTSFNCSLGFVGLSWAGIYLCVQTRPALRSFFGESAQFIWARFLRLSAH